MTNSITPVESPPAGLPPVALPQDELEQIAHELLTDPCHQLRRACQIADYGAAVETCAPAEPRNAPG